MFCQECGTKNDDGAIFCESCGAKLDKEIPVSTPVISKAPVTAKKKDPLLAVMAVEIILMIAVGYMICNIGKTSFGAERVASNYFVNLANGDYKAAYQFMDVSESEFINEEMFVKTRMESQFQNVSSFMVNQEKELNNIFGETQQGLGKDITITYRTTGSESDRSYTVPVSLSVNKEMLFFDSWKVGTESMICNDYVFCIPEGAQLTLDGITLDERYLINDADYGWYYGENYAAYKIPALFCGNHEVLVTMEDRKDFEATVEVNKSDTEYLVEKQNYKPEVIQELMQLAKDDMQTVLAAIFEGKSINSLEGIFTSDKYYSEEINYVYEIMQKQIFENDYYRNFVVDIYNIEATGWNDATVVLNFDYDLSCEKHDFWYDEWYDYSYSDNGRRMEFYFMKEDGKWVLTNLQYLEIIY